MVAGKWIVILTFSIVGGATLLIGAAVFGIDNGVLLGMGKIDFARGLITYLFALVTIGVAVVLVLYALSSDQWKGADDGRFQHGKEVLALLLGVFGTIVGFYFGSETSRANRESADSLQVSTLDLSPQPLGPSGILTVRAVARGGTPPYRFGVAEGANSVELKDTAFEGGWIVRQIHLKPQQKSSETQSIRLSVEDSSGKRTERAVGVRRSSQD